MRTFKLLFLLVGAMMLVVTLVPVHISDNLSHRTVRAGAIFTPEDFVFVRGAPLAGTNGVMFDAQDRLHIASVFGREIVVMDRETGKILDRIGVDRGVEGPDDVTFGPDGSLYWTSILTGEVGRLTPDGKKSTVAQLPVGVNPITFSADGRLFVALDFFGEGLYEIDPAGVKPPRLILEKLGWLNAFDFGPDGLLYGPIFNQGKLVRINVDTGELKTLAEDFVIPGAVKFNAQGQMFVLDQGRGQVFVVDPKTGAKTLYATIEWGLDNLAFDSKDRLFVSNANTSAVVEVLKDGKFRRISPGGLIHPGGVAIMPDKTGESLFVADLWSLRKLNAQTGEEQQIIPLAATTVVRDGDDLVIASLTDNAVAVWKPDTAKVVESHTGLAMPLNAIRFQGDLIVAELGSASVIRLNSAGKRETLMAKMGVPAGLVATKDTLWVGDWATGIVWQLAAAGKMLEKPVQVASGLAGPEGLAVAPDGNLLVVETVGGRLSRIDLATGKVTPIIEGLKWDKANPNLPPIEVLSGVAVSPSGTIYVTNEQARVIYRFNPAFD